MIVLALALTAVLAWPAGVSALTYDGTNPGITPCGDSSHPVYDLGARTAGQPTGPEAIPTPIYSGSTQIGTVEIRHSAFCATVWSRVRNLTGSPVQARETIYYWSDTNGTVGQFSQTEADTLAPSGGTGWSHQYRDRASFQAKGEIWFAGAWRTAFTARSVSWAQDTGVFPNLPYGCNHTSQFECRRWAASAQLGYYIGPSVYAMPNGSEGTRDVSGDVTYILAAFTGFSAPAPGFFPEDRLVAVLTFSSADLSSLGYAAVTYRYGQPLYTSVSVVLSTHVNWGSQNDSRSALCHEVDHALGLNHVWWHNAAGIDTVGSKATCIGGYSSTGPSIDDVSAIGAIYANPVP